VYRVVTDTTPEEIRTTNLSKKVLQNNCLRCHGDIMADIGDTSHNNGSYCFHCHQEIVHEK
ncbi:MAG TPA: cytochrome C nitrite reductase, partial [Syntrophomonadaceae bacterium]|nr:cytochrome C nitrite reductase [Syntrophomonadaceae bacterium]